MKTRKKYYDKKAIIITVILLIIAALTHLYRLSNLPRGLHVDEAGMAYDAWSLANFGVDRYLNSYPVYLINYGGGQSALYAYLAALCIKIFGYSAFAIRLPAFIFSCITIISGVFIVKKAAAYENNKDLPVIMTALFIVMPYFVMSSRFGLDCNLMLGTSTLAICLILYAAGNRSILFYLLAGIASGLVLYTYAISYIVLPVFLIFVLILALLFRRIDIKNAIAFIVPLAVLGIPLVLVQYVNANGLEAMHIGKITIPALTFYRATEFHAPTADSFKEAVKAIFMYDWLDYNSVEQFGTIYYISIPFAVIGLAASVIKIPQCFKERRIYSESLIVIWFLIELVIGSMLGGDGPNANRLNGIFFTVLFFTAYGISTVLGLFQKELRKYMAVIVIIVYGICTIMFAKYYFIDNADHQYYLFQEELDEAVSFVQESDELNYKMIYFVHNNQPYVPPYIFYLLATKESPYDYNISSTGTSSYANYVFDAPEEINPDGVYIVYEGNDEYVTQLQEAGLSNVAAFNGACVIY
ncbi:MAG: glycosyltransferase family 39 protein [Butyrivibrio sp.]|nr:glycosyltransferase family 39 protein [Butyrivibrio sp.]